MSGKGYLSESGFRAGQAFAVLSLAAADLLWGMSFLFGKWALEELGPAQVTLLRFVIGTLALLPYTLVRGIFPKRSDVPVFVLIGILVVPGTFLLQFLGLSMTSASVAALIVGCVPVMIAICAWVFLGETLTGRTWLAVVISSVGVALTVLHPATGNDLKGNILVFVSLLAVVAWVLLSKNISRGYDPVCFTAWVLTFGTVILIPIALMWEGIPPVADLTTRGWVSVLILGLGCSAATYALWNWGASRVPSTRAGVFLNLEPLVGAILGVLVLNDAWGVAKIVGGILIIVAAVSVSVTE